MITHAMHPRLAGAFAVREDGNVHLVSVTGREIPVTVAATGTAVPGGTAFAVKAGGRSYTALREHDPRYGQLLPSGRQCAGLQAGGEGGRTSAGRDASHSE